MTMVDTLSILSAIQLLLAGMIVAVMFSLIEIESGNFWNNALVHAVWNMSTIGLFHIGTSVYDESLFTYVIQSTSQLITGGDFGVEASIFALLGYSIVCCIAFVRIKSKSELK